MPGSWVRVPAEDVLGECSDSTTKLESIQPVEDADSCIQKFASFLDGGLFTSVSDPISDFE
jgi:hypothetical protein